MEVMTIYKNYFLHKLFPHYYTIISFDTDSNYLFIFILYYSLSISLSIFYMYSDFFSPLATSIFSTGFMTTKNFHVAKHSPYLNC